MTVLAVLLALTSIGLGTLGWLAPRYTMDVVDLRPGTTGMGPSEIRAVSGALFVGLGLGVLLMPGPQSLAMLAFAWGGAAVGRATSIVVDGACRKKWTFFAVEAGVTALALGAAVAG